MLKVKSISDHRPSVILCSTKSSRSFLHDKYFVQSPQRIVIKKTVVTYYDISSSVKPFTYLFIALYKIIYKYKSQAYLQLKARAQQCIVGLQEYKTNHTNKTSVLHARMNVMAIAYRPIGCTRYSCHQNSI